MKKYIFVFITIASVYSCCPKDKQKEISPDLIEAWIPYQEGDKIFYHNENNELDSTEVVLIEKAFSASGHWCGMTSETVSMNINGNSFTTLGVRLKRHSISFRLTKDSITKNIYDYDFNDKKSHVFDTPDFFTDIVIGNTNYKNVFGLLMDSVMIYYGEYNGIIGYKEGEQTFIKN